MSCRDSARPLDERVGLDDYLSPQARRLCCLAGGSWSFDRAEAHLHEFCGLRVSDELIRQATEQIAVRMGEFAATAPEPVAEFTAAKGEAEFETDAVKVNTVDGWRDVKIGIFAKRPRGEAAGTEDWADRKLPKHTARFSFAAIEESSDFAVRWAPAAVRLGIDPLSADLAVLGDGAEWIWNRTAEEFPKARHILDIFHAAEKIADTTKILFDDAAEATAQRERGRTLLLSDGYQGLTDWIGELTGLPSLGGDGAALGTMTNYFAGHRDRLNYALRLKRGQTIGSGLVEGAAKNMIGRRLKANNAEWTEENVNRMGVVCSAMYSGYWDSFWESN